MSKGLGRDIAAFVGKMNQVGEAGEFEKIPDGRIIFAMDATSSRAGTWIMAQRIQADMFNALPQDSRMDVQLVYFRGFKECRASKWLSDADSLVGIMGRVKVSVGITQIERVLKHAVMESKSNFINALIFVGDDFEEEPNDIFPYARLLGEQGIPIFMFQEGYQMKVEGVYREIAALSKGAYARFDEGAAQSLADMLKAVATFAVGGMEALEQLGHEGGSARLLLEQMKK